MPWLIPENSYCLLHIKVKPGSHRDQVIGVQEDRLVIALRAKAFEGAANKALIEFLSEKLDIPKRDIELLKGDQARFKVVKVFMAASAIEAKL